MMTGGTPISGNLHILSLQILQQVGIPSLPSSQVAKCLPGLRGASAHRTVASVFGARTDIRTFAGTRPCDLAIFSMGPIILANHILITQLDIKKVRYGHQSSSIHRKIYIFKHLGSSHSGMGDMDDSIHHDHGTGLPGLPGLPARHGSRPPNKKDGVYNGKCR